MPTKTPDAVLETFGGCLSTVLPLLQQSSDTARDWRRNGYWRQRGFTPQTVCAAEIDTTPASAFGKIVAELESLIV